MANARRDRWLHPGAWWAWALCLAASASRTTNPLLLALIVAVAAFVVNARQPSAPWGRSFGFFLRLGVFIIVIRVAVQVLFGANIGQTLLLPLPGIDLPDWMAGIRLGGDITAESVLVALYDGMRLATIIICIGAANSLASPTRLLKSVPSALYELGVSVVVALTFTPQLVSDVDRLRTTRRLRGRQTRGVRAIAASAIPVLEASLERSVALAAAMDSRGYGRRSTLSSRQRLLTTALVLGGLCFACIGVYATISAALSGSMGVALVVTGIAGAAAGTWLSGRTRVRSSYRPDPWGLPEWATTSAGLVTLAAFVFLSVNSSVLDTDVDPPAWPQLPLLAVAALAVAITPAWASPPLPAAERREQNADEHVQNASSTVGAAA